MWNDFGDYILGEAGTDNVRIAEIGVGKFDMIANMLSERENITLIKTVIGRKRARARLFLHAPYPRTPQDPASALCRMWLSLS